MAETSLVEFLTARLDEDEQVARAAARQREAAVAAFKVGRPTDMEDLPEENAAVWSGGSDESAGGHWRQAVWAGDGIATICEMRDEYDSVSPEHIARHDPARVLAEVEAKRRIVVACEESIDQYEDGPAHPILHLLALPYAGHEAYRSEWAP